MFINLFTYLLIYLFNKCIGLHKIRPPFAVMCCLVANDLTDSTGDKRINGQTNRQKEGHRSGLKRKAFAFASGVLINGQIRVARFCKSTKTIIYDSDNNLKISHTGTKQKYRYKGGSSVD